jgi:hypothetical protein
LPQFVAPNDVHKAKAWESISQHSEIISGCVAKGMSTSHSGKEIVQIPAH